MIHLQQDLLDSPHVRRTSGHPVWLARLTIAGWTINGKSRHLAVAWLKATVNYATWLLNGRQGCRRHWWAPRWD
jgi:hypothetical protein